MAADCAAGRGGVIDGPHRLGVERLDGGGRELARAERAAERTRRLHARCGERCEYSEHPVSTVSTRSIRGGGDHVRADEGGRKSRSGECVCARRLETRAASRRAAWRARERRSAAARRGGGAGADQERLEERAAAVPRLHVLLILHSPDRTAAHGMDGARALCRSRALLRGRARRANQCAPRRMRAAHSCHCACVRACVRACARALERVRPLCR